MEIPVFHDSVFAYLSYLIDTYLYNLICYPVSDFAVSPVCKHSEVVTAGHRQKLELYFQKTRNTLGK